MYKEEEEGNCDKLFARPLSKRYDHPLSFVGTAMMNVLENYFYFGRKFDLQMEWGREKSGTPRALLSTNKNQLLYRKKRDDRW